MALQLQGTTPNLQGSGSSLQGSVSSLQGSPATVTAPASVTSMGVQTPSPQVKTSNPPPITSNVTDLSNQYANVNGKIYNKSSGQAYSTPQQFFTASGQNSFNNLKFDTAWTPPTSTLAGLQAPTENGTSIGSNNTSNGLLAAGSTGQGTLGSLPQTPVSTQTSGTLSTNSQGLVTSQNPADTSAAYPNAYIGTQSTNPTYATLSNQAQQLSTPSQQEVNLSNQIAQYQNSLTQAETGTATVGDLEGATGRQTAIQQAGNSTLQSLQNQLTNLQQQRQDALTGIQNQIQTLAPISAAPGTTLINPATGSAIASTNQEVTNIAGAPTSFNPSTGLIGQGSTGQGILGGSSSGSSSNVSSAVSTVLTSLGANDPASNSFITSAVQQSIANGGVVPTNLTAQQQSVVQQVLSQMTGGQYSSTGSAINLANQTAQSQQAQAIVPIAKTALSNLSALQNLSNLVGYSNSPITNDIRNKLSGTAFNDPSITNLQSAIGIVAGELGQVLGGGDATVTALNNAANSLPAGNISPQTLQGLITTLTTLVNNRLTELQNPSNTVTVANGLQMPSGYSASSSNTSAPSASSLDLSL